MFNKIEWQEMVAFNGKKYYLNIKTQDVRFRRPQAYRYNNNDFLFLPNICIILGHFLTLNYHHRLATRLTNLFHKHRRRRNLLDPLAVS